LGLDLGYIMPAYEDPAYWLQKEAELPINVDPSDSKLADPEARARMARVFDHGLNNPRGYVLPVQRWNAPPRWRSERWPLRRNHLFLT
ncbi:transglutaminase family protein, partial [Acinetobacter baumannii]